MKTFKLIVLAAFFLAVSIGQVQAQKNKSKDGVYLTVDEMPEYPGGENAVRSDLAEKIKYPEEARKGGISGKVYISFVIDEKGKVTDAKIERGVDPSLDKESLRVINELKTWKPGKEEGKAVKVAYTIPINFELGAVHKPEKELKQ